MKSARVLFSAALLSASAFVAQAAGLQVGIVLPTKDEPRWIQDQTRFQDALKTAGYKVEILFSQGDSAKERSNVEALITKGAQVIIICPQDGAARRGRRQRGHKNKVKVISYDRLIRDTDAVDYYVTFDSVQVGAAWGKYLSGKAAGKGHNLYLYAGAALRQQRLPLLRGGLERPAAQDRRRHLRRAQLQRGRRAQGQGQVEP